MLLRPFEDERDRLESSMRILRNALLVRGCSAEERRYALALLVADEQQHRLDFQRRQGIGELLEHSSVVGGANRLRSLGRLAGRTLGSTHELQGGLPSKSIPGACFGDLADVCQESIPATDDGLDDVLSQDAPEIAHMGSHEALAHRNPSPDRIHNFRLRHEAPRMPRQVAKDGERLWSEAQLSSVFPESLFGHIQMKWWERKQCLLVAVGRMLARRCL
jgi:hypothetical protein